MSLRDEPGRSREYETIYILRSDTPNESVGQVNSKVRHIVENMGGKILRLDNWGKRKLAYEVRKQLKGIYLYWHYLAAPGVVEELERNLRMWDNVIRYYTVKVDENIDPNARPSDMTDEAFVKAAETAADEEEIMTGQVPRSAFFEEEEEVDTEAEEEAIRRAGTESAREKSSEDKGDKE
ncbi:MAG: 30S ribosomal protein S6 [Deltaproteobacteria bacterium]|nr:30S ribosomal protein S6 [Deltaproteobacteria bacterium]